MSTVTADKSPTTLIAAAGARMEVEQVVKLAGDELKLLLTQRVALLRRLAVLRRTIAGLVEMFGDDVLPEETRALIKVTTPRSRGSGLTEACRAVLSNSSQPLTAREVVDGIRAMNGDLIRHHKDPVSSVTSILQRLGSYGEATTRISQSGRRLWAAVGNHLA
jgi:hypothetical protein